MSVGIPSFDPPLRRNTGLLLAGGAIARILLLPAALGRHHDPLLKAATSIGAVSVLLSLIGFLRWVLAVPPLAAGCGWR